MPCAACVPGRAAGGPHESAGQGKQQKLTNSIQGIADDSACTGLPKWLLKHLLTKLRVKGRSGPLYNMATAPLFDPAVLDHSLLLHVPVCRTDPNLWLNLKLVERAEGGLFFNQTQN